MHHFQSFIMGDKPAQMFSGSFAAIIYAYHVPDVTVNDIKKKKRFSYFFFPIFVANCLYLLQNESLVTC